MRYHNITTADMMNGSGLRVVLWLSGCSHRCKNCHNPQTWDINSGIPFDELAKEELFEELSKDYISGITFSGGDPLNGNNVNEVFDLIVEIKEKFPTKTIWLYTGYKLSELISPYYSNDIMSDIEYQRVQILKEIDVLVDGRFIEELADVNYCWAGSTNQKVIDIKKSLKENKVVLYG